MNIDTTVARKGDVIIINVRDQIIDQDKFDQLEKSVKERFKKAGFSPDKVIVMGGDISIGILQGSKL